MPGPLDDISSSAGTIAGWIAAAGLAAVTALRMVLRGKKELREDRAETHVDATYRTLVDQLKERIDDMDKALENVFRELSMERQARRTAEELALNCEVERAACERARVELARRVTELERRMNGGQK